MMAWFRRKQTRKTPQELHREAQKREKRLIRDFTPPEGVTLTFRVASLGSRFAAQFLDILITGVFILSLIIVLAVIGFDDGDFLTIVATLAFFFIRAPYYVAAELIWNGQTLGKRITKMRVVSADGRSLRPYAVTVRNLMKEMEVFVPGTMLFVLPSLELLEAFLIIVWIGILVMVPLGNRRRQRLGDMIAGTYVIELPRAVLLPDIATHAPAEQRERFSFLAHQLDHYGAFELQTLERILRSRGIRNLLIAGTKTNVCCEATARDAMMLDFDTVMLSDCTAALSDEEHRATLETFIQQFGDVLTGREAVDLVRT